MRTFKFSIVETNGLVFPMASNMDGVGTFLAGITTT